MTTESITEIPFEIEKELWNVYELTDGAQVRIRPIVIKILKRFSDQNDPTTIDFGCETENVVAVSASKDYKWRGAPSTKAYSPEELMKSKYTEVDFRPLVEDWNIYRLEDGSKFKAKLVVSGVQRFVDKFDIYGMPIYNINSSTVVNLSTKEKDTVRIR